MNFNLKNKKLQNKKIDITQLKSNFILFKLAKNWTFLKAGLACQKWQNMAAIFSVILSKRLQND